MEIEEKVAVFAAELKFIKTKSIRDFTQFALGILPDYFFEIPASSTGKFHPSYALGNGGLVRHTRAAVRIANDLMSVGVGYMPPKQEAADCVIAALILHDGVKSGMPKQKYTVKDHAEVVCKHIENAVIENIDVELGLSDGQRQYIYSLMSSHMGQWGAGCPTPATQAQHFVHLCDYLASRKSIEFNFNV